MNNVVLASMNNVVLASMNNVELASMNKVKLVSMDNTHMTDLIHSYFTLSTHPSYIKGGSTLECDMTHKTALFNEPPTGEPSDSARLTSPGSPIGGSLNSGFVSHHILMCSIGYINTTPYSILYQHSISLSDISTVKFRVLVFGALRAATYVGWLIFGIKMTFGSKNL